MIGRAPASRRWGLGPGMAAHSCSTTRRRNCVQQRAAGRAQTAHVACGMRVQCCGGGSGGQGGDGRLQRCSPGKFQEMSGGRRDVCVALVQSLRLFLSGFDHLKGGGDMLVSVNAPPLRPTHKHTNSPSPAIRGPMGTGSAASCGLSSQGGGQHRYLPAN